MVDAFDIVSGEEQQPPAANGAAAKAALDSYRKRRGLAAHLLKHACMPNIQIYIRDLADPREIWDTMLRRLDFMASETGRAAILTRFLNTRPEPEERVGAYIARLPTYQTQLHGTEEAISDGLLKSRIYETVPPQFKSLVTILRETPNITIETIIARLSLDGEERRNKSSNEGLALYTYGTGSGHGRGRGRGGNRGNRGNRGGNRGGRGQGGQGNRSGQGGQGGQVDGQQNQSNRRNLAEVVCYQCGKIGRYQRDCPVKHEVDEVIREVKRRRTQAQQSQVLVATNQETSLVRANQANQSTGRQLVNGTGLID